MFEVLVATYFWIIGWREVVNSVFFITATAAAAAAAAAATTATTTTAAAAAAAATRFFCFLFSFLRLFYFFLPNFFLFPQFPHHQFTDLLRHFVIVALV